MVHVNGGDDISCMINLMVRVELMTGMTTSGSDKGGGKSNGNDVMKIVLKTTPVMMVVDGDTEGRDS